MSTTPSTKLLPIVLASLALLMALLRPGQAQAGVIEQSVTLPDGLGSGILFMSDELDRITAGIIVVHASWGQNQYVQDRARMFAKEGYVAITVDMYGDGKVANHPEDARQMMQQALAHPEKMKARFDAVQSILRNQQYIEDNRIFAVGYGFGGRVLLDLARQGEDVAGIAVFHGALDTDTPMQAGVFKGRVFIAAGLDDPLVPREQISAVTEELADAGVACELLTFPGARHAFTNPKADEYGRRFDLPLAYDPRADHVSWEALLDFIDRH